MEEKKLLGRRIKSLRRRRGYSQETLAEIVGISSRYVSRIETGKENPTLDLFLRLAKGLKVRLYEIFQFEHEGERPQRVRKRLESLVAEVKEEDLSRIARVLEVLVH
jgi:transcriptional regulator with XRE-family HTH domain